MWLRIAITLATLLGAISAPGVSSAADIGDGHVPFHDALGTSVISFTVPGPSTLNSIASATTAPCPKHDVLIGGGTLEAGSTSNGLHLNGSVPSTPSGSPDVNANPPTNWTAGGATGNQAAPGATTTAFAMCLADGPRHLRVIEADATGPAQSDSWTRATATCPDRFVAVGGGASTEPGTAGGLKPIGSFPSDAGGNPVTRMAVNPTSWTAVGLNGGQPAPGALTRAFVVCARARQMSTQIVSVDVAGPTAAGTSMTATAVCPTHGATRLLGGGVYVTASGGIPSTGIHLRGTFPSDSSGGPITSGHTDAWTGVVHTGGQVAPGTDTTVFALCARPRTAED